MKPRLKLPDGTVIPVSEWRSDCTRMQRLPWSETEPENVFRFHYGLLDPVPTLVVVSGVSVRSPEHDNQIFTLRMQNGRDVFSAPLFVAASSFMLPLPIHVLPGGHMDFRTKETVSTPWLHLLIEERH